MKKILVLVALTSLVATSAFGLTIVGSKHDLKASGSGNTEICSYCHTPHAGGTQAPLWNRGAGTAATANYTSATMNATSTDVNTDARLCLSCHDSSSLTSVVITNIPNGLSYSATSITTTLSTWTDLGTTLDNDHPIGITLAGAGGVAGGFYATPTNAAVRLFGAGADTVWCSSCHNVHDNGTQPFLAMANTASALCLACHNK